MNRAANRADLATPWADGDLEATVLARHPYDGVRGLRQPWERPVEKCDVAVTVMYQRFPPEME